MRSTIQTVEPSGRLADSLLLLGRKRPRELHGLGAVELLERPSLGLLCSRKCPGDAILAAYDVSKRLEPDTHIVLGGFHSPMEKQFLEILLARHVPSVVCVPRPLRGMRIPSCWKGAIDEGRLLVLSPITSGNRRFSRSLAEMRNILVGALADPLFVPCASPGGSVERLLPIFAGWGKVILTVECNNQPILRAAGAQGISEWLLAPGSEVRKKNLVLL